MITGTVFDIKEMSVHDGPGLRTTVFLKGCPLRCRWCHNPEGLSPEPQLMKRHNSCTQCGLCKNSCGHPECSEFGVCIYACPRGCLEISGKVMTVEEVRDRVMRGADILRSSGGGVTFSGGEPLYQPDFLRGLLDALSGLHRTVETSGYASAEVFRDILGKADLFLFDIKHTSPETHKLYTGKDNAPILDNYRLLAESGVPYIIRVPIIPGVNDGEENLRNTAVLAAAGKGLAGVELLGYNRFAGAKYGSVGMKYNFASPADDAARDLLAPFRERGIKAVYKKMV